MRVPDELIDCVCFVTSSWGNESTVGTAFFVGVPLGLSDELMTDSMVIYAVTAKHCLTNDHGLAGEVVLRANYKQGGSGPIHAGPASDWLLHSTADVAVLPLTSSVDRPFAGFRIKAYPVDHFATAGFVLERKIGSGDDVFVMGLLVHHPGASQIMPIVRVGNIAALPDEAVNLTTGPDVAALVEVRSIGGLSGSPVVLHLPFWRDSSKGDIFVGGGGEATSGGDHRLLGVMHGFFPVGKNDPDGVSGGNENLNTGIAVVILADRILDLINCAQQRTLRHAWRAALTAPRPD